MDNTTRIINGKEYVKYPYKYVTSKYSIFTEKGADYAYKLIRFAGSDAEEDLTDQIGNNVFRDIILELLELRRALDAAEAQLAETTTPKSTTGIVDGKFCCTHNECPANKKGFCMWSLNDKLISTVRNSPDEICQVLRDAVRQVVGINS